MNETTLATAIAAFALGANALGIALLLLFNPRSRRVRWYALFTADICLWLFLQTWIYGRGEIGDLRPWYEASVHMLPGLFVANAVAVDMDRGNLAGWAVVAVSLATLPVSVGHLTTDASIWVIGWHVLGWGAGIAIEMTCGYEAPDPDVRRRTRWTILAGLMVIGPGAVLYGFLTGGGGFFVFAMPLITVLILFLVFMGVVHLRFYDIEVRALRTGEMAARATEIERLAVVGELAASLAHEVRNPLTGVRSLGQRLGEEDLPAERRKKYADVIVREVGRVEQIVSNLLDVARRDASEPVPADRFGPTDLETLFDDVVLLVAGRARRADVTIGTDAGGLAVAASRDPLAQALLNLLLNAVDHSPEGGVVRLDADRADGRIEIRVRDRGPGIPEGDRKRIFEPLYSGSGGTGLGLAVVRRIADAHGWSVDVADAPGGGAELRLSLPAAGEPTR